MHPNAIEHARDKFIIATESLTPIESNSTFKEHQRAWIRFLWATKGVVEKLKVGSQGNRKSEAWYSMKIEEIKRDPLLQYLYHARNSDEHGVSPVVEQSKWQLRLHQGEFKIHETEETITVTNTGHLPAKIGFTPSVMILVPVTTNKKEKKIISDPPKEHLGKRIDDPTPLGVAHLAIAYLHNLILEAEKLV